MKWLNLVWISLFALFLAACNGESVTIDSMEITETLSESSEGQEQEAVEASSESTVEDISSELAEFKKATGVYLDAKTVQYDMENHLDKEFYLTGQLRLCDYYNYGYTNQSKVYCAELHPDDGSDYWYLYFSREKTRPLYNELLQGDIDLKLTALIHKEVYRQGQGNMAAAMQIPLKYISNNSQ
jgi:hypothetical protein